MPLNASGELQPIHSPAEPSLRWPSELAPGHGQRPQDREAFPVINVHVQRGRCSEDINYQVTNQQGGVIPVHILSARRDARKPNSALTAPPHEDGVRLNCRIDVSQAESQ